MIADKNKTTSYFLISILAIIWGSSFILMKKGLEVYTWNQVGAIRMLTSFIVLFPFVWNKFKLIDKSLWKYIAITGFCGNLLPSFLFPLAQTHVSSALAGILNSLTPLFTLVLGVIFFKARIPKNKILGVLIGLAGACMIVLAKSKGAISGSLEFSLLVVLATVSYAISVNVLRYKLTQLDSILITGFALMFAGIPCSIYLFTTDFIPRTQAADGAATCLLAIVVLAIFGTAISTFLFNRLIKTSGALFAASVTYLIPFVAILWGIGFGEQLAFVQMIGLCIILFGVYLINRKGKA